MTYIIQSGIFFGPDYLVGPMLTRHKTLRRMRSYCNRVTPLQREALKTALEDTGLSSLPVYAESVPWRREKSRLLYACAVYSTAKERAQTIHYLTSGINTPAYG